MTQAVAQRDGTAIAEQVLLKGDLASLNPKERVAYYKQVCESVGLNPLTKPFEYITLNGKLTLYALRGATDQLRALHKVSVTEMTEAERDGVVIVTVKVQNAEGRTDMAKGAVTIANLKGDALANAFMKAETKAKRRATLSICGLGFLDETEVETIPDASLRKSSYRARKDGDFDFTAELDAITTVADLEAWREKNADRFAKFPKPWLESFETEVYQPKLAALSKALPVNGEATLSTVDSAAMVKALIATVGRCETQTALRHWVRDPETKASIRSLIEADYETFEAAYEARMSNVPE